jgi:hypothetical protein
MRGFKRGLVWVRSQNRFGLAPQDRLCVNIKGYVKTRVVDVVNTSRTPEEVAHSPSWPNGLIIIIS